MTSSLAEKLSFVNFGEVCRGCTVNCCKRFYAVLLADEEHRFREESFQVDTPLGPVRAIGSRDGKPCPFLGEDGLCTVYPQRPFDCRLWPILLYYDFATGEKVVYLDLECPAVAEGRIGREFIEKVTKVLQEVEIDVTWLKKYTLAPWPNRLVEVARFK